MIVRKAFLCWVLGLALALAGLAAHAEASCRLAFDVGSSGVRVAASNSATEAQVDIDYLSPLWAGRGLEETWKPTVAALNNLPVEAGFSPACDRVAGAFSAWRLAWQQAAGDTTTLMARLQADTRVAVLVMPQAVEGAYAYASARQVLGPQLRTSHVLDIGGGSLQIAGAQTTYGQALGQKSWHQLLCATLRPSASATCALQPMSADDLRRSRSLLDDKFSGMAKTLGQRTTLTAISRPITRGVAPAVGLLVGGKTSAKDQLLAQDVSAAITRLAPLSTEKAGALLTASSAYAGYLLSDMLLLEGVLRATQGSKIQVIEGRLSILPALLADDTAFQWSARYGCYLDRFKVLGPDAYFSDPATCMPR